MSSQPALTGTPVVRCPRCRIRFPVRPGVGSPRSGVSRLTRRRTHDPHHPALALGRRSRRGHPCARRMRRRRRGRRRNRRYRGADRRICRDRRRHAEARHPAAADRQPRVRSAHPSSPASTLRSRRSTQPVACSARRSPSVTTDSGDTSTDIASQSVDRLLSEEVDTIIGAASSGVTKTVIDAVVQSDTVSSRRRTPRRTSPRTTTAATTSAPRRPTSSRAASWVTW